MIDGLGAEEIHGLLDQLAAELHERARKPKCSWSGVPRWRSPTTRRSTRDVDAVFTAKQVVYDAASAVAERHGLQPTWLNDGVKVPPWVRPKGRACL